MSRNKERVTSQYPELSEVFSAQSTDDFIVDGEIVAFDRGRTSFARLQHRMHVLRPSPSLLDRVPVHFYAFDLLYAAGHLVGRLPLRHRKAVLRRSLSFRDPLRFTSYRNTEGIAYYEEACRRGWEGVIAKRADAAYESRRSKRWLKFKCSFQQEFVIGGYTDPRGSRQSLGALLIGYHEGDELKYAGKVGTGFGREMLGRLRDLLSPVEREDAPFDKGRALPRKGVHWVEPRYVAEVAFSEWTDDGRLRHPRFLGLRHDKEARDVVRELPGR
ncbi:MAG: non-homologous end-joining DNA ligase, partial [Actinomycetota bacterium]